MYDAIVIEEVAQIADGLSAGEGFTVFVIEPMAGISQFLQIGAGKGLADFIFCHGLAAFWHCNRGTLGRTAARGATVSSLPVDELPLLLILL